MNERRTGKILNGGAHWSRAPLHGDASCNILSMFSRRTRWNLETNSFTRAVQEYRRSGAEFFDLTASNPTQVGFALDADAILQAISHSEALEYDPQPLGIRTARLAISEYYNTFHVQVEPERLLLTTSTSEAYSFVFRLLCDPDDEVLIPTPSYPLFEYLAQIQDVRLIPYELVYDHGWQIDFHSLERAITARTRAIILVNPNNPTGSFVRESERVQLNHFCREHSLALIVDEVFFDFNLASESFLSFAGNDEVLTFTLSGLSKVAGLPQMKVAWIVTSGPKELVEPAQERLEVIADTYLSMNAPIQYAVPELLKLRISFQAQLMQRLRKNLAELDRQLNCQKTLTRLVVDGGWYATIRVPVTQSDEQLVIALLRETGVFVHPGHFFDFASDGYLILSLMTPEKEFVEGSARLMKFFETI